MTQFKLTSSEILNGANEAIGLPNPHSTEDAETLVLILEDKVASLELKLTTLLMLIAATISTHAEFEIYQIKQVVSIVFCNHA